MQPITPRQRVVPFDLATCLAIDAGCMLVSGLAGSIAFGFAWIILKAGGVI